MSIAKHVDGKANDIAQWRERCLAWLEKEQPFDAAHDLQHLQRVVANARDLARREGADMLVIEVAGWLHDCVIVSKASPDRPKASRMAALRARQFLEEAAMPMETIDAIHHAIEAHSFSAGLEVKSKEAAVLRDADRLDAIGAVGLYRVIAAGAAMGRVLYTDEDPFCKQRNADDRISIIDHFYTKLLTLEHSMLTDSGRLEAVRRTRVLREYLDELEREIGSGSG